MEKQKTRSFWRIFLYIFPFIFKLDDFWLNLRLAATVLMTLVTIVINVSVPIVLRKLIAALGIVSPPAISTLVVWLLLSYGFIWTAGQSLSQLRDILVTRVFAKVLKRLSVHIFAHLQNLSIRFHVSKHTGGVTAAIAQVQSAVPMIALGAALWVFPVVCEILLSSFILTYFYGLIFGGILFGLFAVYLIFTLWYSDFIFYYQRAFNRVHIEAGAIMTDSLMNIETVKYFNNTHYEIERCRQVLSDREHAEGSFYQALELSHFLQSFIIGLGLLVMTFTSGWMVMKGRLVVSDFVMINGYVMQFVFPFMLMSKIIREINKSVAQMQNAMHLLTLKPDIKEHEKPVDIGSSEQVEIEFQDVFFGYYGNIRVLKGVSFDIPRGKSIAIVGSTGVGKSTMTKLMFRFYDVSEGKILINGHNIKSISRDSLNSVMAVVPQSAAMFNSTLRFNILYGNPEATDEELTQAIEAAHLQKFISDLPKGLETRVGEHGIMLSGGERQRVAIARALLKKPKFFVFDEATSALDTATERSIQANLREISKGVTCMIIAHRLSTVTYADKIIVMEGGLIKESGNHRELMSQKGAYYDLWQNQFDSKGG